MAGSSNFLQWNPGANNQETDASYVADSQRTGGAPNGVDFPSTTANKLFYNLSTFVAALASSLADKGYVLSDSNISTLKSVLANLVTQADLKLNLSSVGFSTTPTFNALTTNGFDFVMAANVSSSSLTGYAIGQTITFVIKQGGAAFTFSPPPNINGWIPIDPTINSVTVQSFIVRADNTIWPVATEINILIADIIALQTAIAGLILSATQTTPGRSFGTTYQNTSGGVMLVTGYGSTSGSSTGSVTCRVGSGSPSTIVYANASTATVSGGAAGFTFTVPPGFFYSVTAAGAVSGPTGWAETIISI